MNSLEKKTEGRRAALHNLGCKVNQYETDAMEQLLKDAGYKIVPFGPGADVYVINTCTVTNIADRKSRQMLRRARQFGPEACIVAAGCYVNEGKETLLKDEIADILIGNNRKGNLPGLLDRFFEEKREKGEKGEKEILQEVPQIRGEKAYESLSIGVPDSHTRAFMKIQDGCNQFCSYCAIPLARGPVRSRLPEEIREEALCLTKGGVKEIVLTGIHISSYGSDLPGRPDLAGVIRELGRSIGPVRLRLGSLEPRIVTEEFVRALKETGQICPHFHLSLQSGCADTLKRMNRRYTPEEYAASAALLKEAFPDCALTTDVICGFPGETEDEFAESRAFLEKVGFYELHVFPFSARRGTKAAVMDGQVPESVRKDRTRELIGLSDGWARAFREQTVGKTVRVLLEEETTVGGNTYMTGFTENYLPCAFPGGKAGDAVTGTALRLDGSGILICGF